MSTNITANSGVSMPGADAATSRYPMTSPTDAARTILDGVEDDRLHILVGRDAWLMNAASRVAPRRAVHLIQKQMKKLMPAV